LKPPKLAPQPSPTQSAAVAHKEAEFPSPQKDLCRLPSPQKDLCKRPQTSLDVDREKALLKGNYSQVRCQSPDHGQSQTQGQGLSPTQGADDTSRFLLRPKGPGGAMHGPVLHHPGGVHQSPLVTSAAGGGFARASTVGYLPPTPLNANRVSTVGVAEVQQPTVERLQYAGGLRSPGHGSATASANPMLRHSPPGADSSNPSRIPRTEAIPGGTLPPNTAPAQCHLCRRSEDLRRVRCCGVRYCMKCLTELVAASVERPSNPLTCMACRAAWDLQQLARACRIEVPHQHGASGGIGSTTSY